MVLERNDKPSPMESTIMQRQVDLFNLTSLNAREAYPFRPEFVDGIVEMSNNNLLLAIDIGGDKIETRVFLANNGILHDMNETTMFRSRNGVGYLSFLEGIAHSLVTKPTMPVGISSAGLVEGAHLINISTAPQFMEEFGGKYGCNFARLFPGLKSVVNDAVAGMISGSVEAKKRYPKVKHFVYMVNGSSLGAAVLKDDVIWSTEPGHIKIMDELNIHGQTRTCQGLCNKQGVCLKWVAASGAGIEDLWYQKTGNKLDGRQISQLFQDGNILAQELYDNSARLVTYILLGLINAFGINPKMEDAAVICHGGCFNVPGYGQKVHKLLEVNIGRKINMVYTNEYSNNACLHGAALSALI